MLVSTVPQTWKTSCCRTRDHPGYRDLACLLTRLPCLAGPCNLASGQRKSHQGERQEFSGLFYFLLFLMFPHPHVHCLIPSSSFILRRPPCFSLLYLLQTLNIPVLRCIGNSYFHLESVPAPPSSHCLFAPSSPLVWSNPTSQDQPLCIQTSKSRDSNALSHRFYLPAHILRHDRFRRFSTIDSFFLVAAFVVFPRNSILEQFLSFSRAGKEGGA